MVLQPFSGLRPALTLPLALLLCCCAGAAAAGTPVTVSTAKFASRSDKEVPSCMGRPRWGGHAHCSSARWGLMLHLVQWCMRGQSSSSVYMLHPASSACARQSMMQAAGEPSEACEALQLSLISCEAQRSTCMVNSTAGTTC